LILSAPTQELINNTRARGINAPDNCLGAATARIGLKEDANKIQKNTLPNRRSGAVKNQNAKQTTPHNTAAVLERVGDPQKLLTLFELTPAIKSIPTATTSLNSLELLNLRNHGTNQ
jgi:hypothetical protein